MCNLYSHTRTVDAMRQLFDIPQSQDHLGNLAAEPAIFPRQEAPVLRLDAEGQRELVMMHWGFLLPQVSKRTGKPILPKAVNNARDDKLRSSPFWRKSLAERRCLVPATAFCEAKGSRPATYFWFTTTDEPLVFAGLWNRVNGMYRDVQVSIETFTIVTTLPNILVAPIHPTRMPVILHHDRWASWLWGTADEAFQALAPYPADRMCIVASGEAMQSYDDVA